MEIATDRVRFALNPFRQTNVPPALAPPAPPDVQAVHRSLPGYAPTPLVVLPALAAELGLGAVLPVRAARSERFERGLARATDWGEVRKGGAAPLRGISEGATDPESYRRIVGADPV